MRELPVIFNDEMVRAVLDGRKTQTRRPIGPQPPTVEAVRAKAGIDFSIFTDHHAPDEFRVGGPVWAVRELMGRDPRWRCPLGAPSDVLWVRECFGLTLEHDAEGEPTGARAVIGTDGLVHHVIYRASSDPDLEWCDGDGWAGPSRWRPSIHMPRWASRLTLRVTDVRVERAQDITEEDARAEGVTGPHDVGYPAYQMPGDTKPRYSSAAAAFAGLWDSIYAAKGLGWDANPWVWAVSFEPVEVERG